MGTGPSVGPAVGGSGGSSAAAAGRVDAFLARLDRLALEDLRLLSLPLPDPDARAALLARVDVAAATARRRELVTEARERARDAIVRAYASHQYEPTWAGLNWGRSLGTARDRLGLALAAEDAATAAALSDVLEEDALDDLREPFERAAGMAGSTPPQALLPGRPGSTGWLAWVALAALLATLAAAAATGAAVAIGGVGAGLVLVALAVWRRSR